MIPLSQLNLLAASAGSLQSSGDKTQNWTRLLNRKIGILWAVFNKEKVDHELNND